MNELKEKRERNYRNKIRLVKSSYDTAKVGHLDLGPSLACGQKLVGPLHQLNDDWPLLRQNKLCVDCAIAYSRLCEMVVQTKPLNLNS